MCFMCVSIVSSFICHLCVSVLYLHLNVSYGSKFYICVQINFTCIYLVVIVMLYSINAKKKKRNDFAISFNSSILSLILKPKLRF